MSRITMCIEEEFSGKVIGSFDLTEYADRAYNQALDDAEKRYREWSKTEYGKVVADDALPLRVLRSLTK